MTAASAGMIENAALSLARRVADGAEMPTRAQFGGEVTLSVEVSPDADSHPSESDVYGPADVETFNEGEWRFVGVRAVIEYRGVRVESGGLWSVELGRSEGDLEVTYLAGVIAGELREAIDAVRDLTKLLEAAS